MKTSQIRVKTYSIREANSRFAIRSFVQVFSAPSWEVIMTNCNTGESKSIDRKQAAKELKRKHYVAFLSSSLHL